MYAKPVRIFGVVCRSSPQNLVFPTYCTSLHACDCENQRTRRKRSARSYGSLISHAHDTTRAHNPHNFSSTAMTGPQDPEKHRAMWDDDRDLLLLQTLLEQKSVGKRTDKGWKKEAWTAVVIALNERFPGPRLNRAQVKNRGSTVCILKL